MSPHVGIPFTALIFSSASQAKCSFCFPSASLSDCPNEQFCSERAVTARLGRASLRCTESFTERKQCTVSLKKASLAASLWLTDELCASRRACNDSFEPSVGSLFSCNASRFYMHGYFSQLLLRATSPVKMCLVLVRSGPTFQNMQLLRMLQRCILTDRICACHVSASAVPVPGTLEVSAVNVHGRTYYFHQLTHALYAECLGNLSSIYL